jgi:hypothetical protein
VPGEGLNHYHAEETMMNTRYATRLLTLCLCLLAVSSAPANAAVEMNDSTNFSMTSFVPCAAGGAGELVDLSGTLHTLLSFTINGNNISGFFHSQPQGVSGIGEITGAKYQATGVLKLSFRTSFQNGQANVSSVNNLRIIGQGPGNNFTLRETLHLTFNADGTVTVFHDNFSMDCK